MGYLKRLYTGRLGRMHYASALVMFFVVTMALIAVPAVTFNTFDPKHHFGGLFTIFTLVVILAEFVHIIPLHIRRFHDFGASGWWTLTCFIPGVGAVVLLMLLLRKGDASANKFGDKAPENAGFLNTLFNRELSKAQPSS